MTPCCTRSRSSSAAQTTAARYAASQPFAQARLGVAYVQGKGIPSNLVEGYAWLAASEVSDAQPVVKELDKKLPAPLLAKAKKLAAERRALRDAKKPQPPEG